MANKLAILENVDMYTADELIGFINDGTVTFEELCDDTDGCFPAKVRKDVEKMLKGSEEDDWAKAKASNSVEALQNYLSKYLDGAHREEARTLINQLNDAAIKDVNHDAWIDVDKTSVNALKEFKQTYPDDPHCVEATKLINEILMSEMTVIGVEALSIKIKNIQANKNVINKDEEIHKLIVDSIQNGKFSTTELKDMIQADNNIIRVSVVKQLMSDGYLDVSDLLSLGINREFIRHLANEDEPQAFPPSSPLDKINKVSTEVYFWGIPSSGKSCALGAILSVAGNGRVAKSMTQDNDCQGYGYMRRLSSLFNGGGAVCTLPPGTSIYATNEMGFDLEDQEDKTHPLTCVDLAGELVRCMFKADANEDMSDDEMEALDTLTRILIDNRSRNRKIHFFVLEYGAEDRKYEGLNQKVYLDGALRYIDRTGIFKKDTDAIYLMITKVDKAKAGKGQLAEILKKYISENYGGFYNGLVKICKDCEINNGRVEIVPFSLGNVCFQDLCMFDEIPASNVVRNLISRSKGIKHGKLQTGLNLFKK